MSPRFSSQSPSPPRSHTYLLILFCLLVFFLVSFFGH